MFHTTEEKTDELEQLVQDLHSKDRSIRTKAGMKLDARARLLAEFQEPLRQLAFTYYSPANRTAIWLLRRLGKETTKLWGDRASDILCPTCLTHFTDREISISGGENTTYYSCRMCGQSREFLDISAGGIVVLDARMKERYTTDGGVIRLNWLLLRSLFDFCFDSVEIIEATDEEVERFAVQVGNDTYEKRKQVYEKMSCIISSGCSFSDNTLRILKHVFGQVRLKENI